MTNYSITTALYANEFIDYRDEVDNLANKFWQSNYSINDLNEYSKLVSEGNILLEFSVKDFVRNNLENVLQAGIGFALETGISVGTLGAGAPAGVAAEMVNDMVFFGYSAADAIASIKNLFTQMGDLKDAIKQMFSSNVKDAPQKIYDRVKSVINRLGSFLKKLGLSVEKGIEKFIEIYRKLMNKMGKVAGDVVGLISPIPGTDAVVQNAIVEFTDDAYKFLLKAFDKLPAFAKKYINDPSALVEDGTKIIEAGIAYARNAVEKLNNIGNEKKKGASFFEKAKKVYIKSLIDYSPAGKIYKFMKSQNAMTKVVDFLEENAVPLLEKAAAAYEKIYPVIISCASALTIFASGDHDLKKKDSDLTKEGKILFNEELSRNFQTLDNMPYKMEDNLDLDVNMYSNGDGTWSAKITHKNIPNLSTPLRKFNDESDANDFVRKHVDFVARRQFTAK